MLTSENTNDASVAVEILSHLNLKDCHISGYRAYGMNIILEHLQNGQCSKLSIDM